MEEKKYFNDLNREVIETGKCTLCGGCVATCKLLDVGYLSVSVEIPCQPKITPSASESSEIMGTRMIP